MVNEATAKARRSEALFRSSNAGISRRWLTDKVADLEWECARLRVQLEDATTSNGRLEERCSKLQELLIDAYKDMDAWQMVIANSDQWGYGKGCLERLRKLREAMCNLGIEADS